MMAEYLEGKCRDCFNLAPCAAWIKHGTMLYSDFSYSVEGCQYFVSAADVALVVHGRWIPSESDFDDDDTLFDVEDWCDWQCSACHTDIFYKDPMERRWLPKFCPHCGARMDGE